MSPAKNELEQRLQSPFETPVWLFSGTNTPLLREAEGQVLRALASASGEDDYTRVDGPAPNIPDVIEAAGAISLFGDVRVVLLREITPAQMGDKDAAELAELFSQLENALLVVTVLHKDEKAAKTKKAKQLFDAAAKAGYAAELKTPGRRENLDYIKSAAAALGASFAPGAAEALLDRAGEDRPLLQNEASKLAAMAGYGVIGEALVEKYSVHNIEADVFALVRHITAGKRAVAFGLLRDLFALRHEPVAIVSALAGTFVDMLRVRAGERSGRASAAVFSEMGYRGNPWRLQKAKENARRYRDAALDEAVLDLAALDMALRSTALADRDKGVLVEAAVERLIDLGSRP